MSFLCFHPRCCIPFPWISLCSKSVPSVRPISPNAAICSALRSGLLQNNVTGSSRRRTTIKWLQGAREREKERDWRLVLILNWVTSRELEWLRGTGQASSLFGPGQMPSVADPSVQYQCQYKPRHFFLLICCSSPVWKPVQVRSGQDFALDSVPAQQQKSKSGLGVHPEVLRIPSCLCL